ncbi:MAG: type VI secretion system tip protein VgrG [Caldilineaceae bacterium]
MSVVTVTMISDGQPLPPEYELLALDITREVNRIPYAQIVLLDGDAAQQSFSISNSRFFEPGRQIEIKLRYEGESQSNVTVFKGPVVGQAVEADQQGSLLTVELKDAAIKMTQTRKSAVYRDQNDDKIIGSLITQHGLRKGIITATQLRHAELVQYQCTDWDFLLTRAEALGLLVLVEDGQISMPAIEMKGTSKHTFTYGLSEIFSFAMAAEGSHQYAAVQSTAWDMKNQKLTTATKAKEFTLAQGNLNGGRVAKALGRAPYLLNSTVPLSPNELQAWSDSMLARNRLALLRGRIGVPGIGTLKLLDLIEIAGVSRRFNGKALVTGIRHRVTLQGWQTDIQFGLPPERLADRAQIADYPAAGLLPAVHGLQIGIVDAFEADPDKQWRVKVILPGIDEKQGTLWARLAAPDAGKERGYFFRPEPGDEVVLGFFNDDPRQAVILGALYSAKNTPPKAVATVTKENKDKAIVSKKGSIIRFLDDDKAKIMIETPGANKIMLDDDAQEIKVSDQHGNTIILGKDGIVLKSAKDLKLEASGNVEIKGAKVDVK